MQPQINTDEHREKAEGIFKGSRSKSNLINTIWNGRRGEACLARVSHRGMVPYRITTGHALAAIQCL